jgi:hypothetical protein
MNHYKNTTLAIAAIVATVAMTAAGFAIPQQALAYGHHHHHNHHGTSIEVSQDTTQINACTNFTVCTNDANNSADINR